MKSLVILGIAGLQIVTILNLLASLYLALPSAALLSPDWWSIWFPNYALGLAFIVIGLLQDRKTQTK